MAASAPRTRKRKSASLDRLQSLHGNPVKKPMMEFCQEQPVVKMPASLSFTPPMKEAWMSQHKDKENQPLPRSPAKPRKLNTSPLQTASVPAGIWRECPPTTSPRSGTTYSSIVPTGSFYSKGKLYVNILERKVRNDIHRNGDGNLPPASKTEASQLKVMPSRNTSAKTSKRPAASREAKVRPANVKKPKMERVPLKPAQKKENARCAVEKKMGAPFKVLSMKFKPALKLQVGAAFFATGKKAHSGFKFSAPLSAAVSKHLAHTKPHLSTDVKATEAGRKENHACKSPKEKRRNHVEDEKKLVQNTSKPVERVSKLDLWPKTGFPQISPFGCSEPLAQKEMDTETQGSEEIPQTLHGNMNKCEAALSSDIAQTLPESSLANVTHPVFGMPSSSKKRPRILPEEQPGLVEFRPSVQKAPLVLRSGKKAEGLRKAFKDQMTIDAGQKYFGAVVCKSCGMVYSAANPEDEVQHTQFHQRFLEGIKYVGWKKEHIVAEFWDGKIVLISQDDPKYALKKAASVRELVDNELGFQQGVLTSAAHTRTYLFVAQEKIVGCLIAEPVQKAFRVLSEPAASLSPAETALEHHRAWCCSTKPEKVVCGVSRVWVFSLMRRKGIASRLVDVVRRTFLFGSCLSINEIAFSDPTPDGRLFAVKYCQTPNFLVYNFIN